MTSNANKLHVLFILRSYCNTICTWLYALNILHAGIFMRIINNFFLFLKFLALSIFYNSHKLMFTFKQWQWLHVVSNVSPLVSNEITMLLKYFYTFPLRVRNFQKQLFLVFYEVTNRRHNNGGNTITDGKCNVTILNIYGAVCV